MTPKSEWRRRAEVGSGWVIPPVDPDVVEEELDRRAAEDILRGDELEAPVETWEPEAPDLGTDEPYPDWNADNSFVLSGPLEEAKFPGRRFGHWREAEAHVTETARTRGVKLFKFWTIPGRWFGRIGKVHNG